MQKKIVANSYHYSATKRIFDLFVSFFGLILLSPLILIFVSLVKLADREPFLFRQKRAGLRGKIFKLIKFRTMVNGAQKLQKKYKKINEADGPVFKIHNDPRYTRFGKFLAHTGLDELPQFINVLKGEMSIVGPRPLPVYEAKKLTRQQKVRELVKPGITSCWVVKGSHKLKFSEWMKLDREYVQNASLPVDLKIIFETVKMVLKSILRQIS